MKYLDDGREVVSNNPSIRSLRVGKYPRANSWSGSEKLIRDRPNLGGYRFLVIIDLRNGMKWRVLLELTTANGNAETRELVTSHRPTSAISPEAIGLTLAEGKFVLAAMQI